MSETATPQPVLRAVLALVVAADLLLFPIFVADARANALADGVAPSVFADLVSQPVARWSIALIGAAAALVFARRPGRLGGGLLALGGLMLFSTTHTELFGSPWRHTFFSGACLSGWLLGVAASRWRGEPDDESLARTGATALLGAAYLNAGISKLAFGGLDWLSGAPIQAIIVAQEGLVGGGVLGAYRLWVVNVPAAAAFFSIATVLFELGGPLLLIGAWPRRLVALGLLGMHLNIFLLTNILYWESLVLLTLFGLWPAAPEPSAAPRASSPRFAVAAAVLGVAALLAIAHQMRRYEATQLARDAAVPARGPNETPPSAPLTVPRVGPFALRDVVARDWSVDALTLNERGVIVALTGGAGRAAFELTCAPTADRSPFDLDALHIFYSSALPVPAFEAAGRAVQTRVRADAGSADPCAAVARWRDEALAARTPSGS